MPAQQRATYIILILMILWGALTYALYYRKADERATHTQELALIQARTLFNMVTDARAWNAAHGGVYVLQSEYGTPNTWIPEGQRTIAAKDGRTLVLVNPAYMSRQMSERTTQRGTSFRITSHTPLRPANKADAWETQALLRCIEGAPEVFDLTSDDPRPHYRYMGVLLADRSCLGCHKDAVVGDVRGGVSVNMDAVPFLQAMKEQNHSLQIAFGFMGLSGVLTIGGGGLLLGRRRALQEEKERLKSSFLANMSHDMRTPLTGILGMSEILQEDKDPAKQHKALRYLKAASGALLEMVNDITDYAALDNAKVQLVSAPFDLRETVQACVGLFTPQCQAKQLELTCHVDDDIPRRFYGDAFRLGQVLGNLVSNAVKFTEEGQVEITVSRDKNATGTADAFPLCFAVTDTGMGIEAKEQERIFVRFERGRTMRRLGLPGTGLGLSIAQELVQRMGGQLAVRSHPFAGSCFYFSILLQPVADDSTTDGHSIAQGQIPAGQKYDAQTHDGQIPANRLPPTPIPADRIFANGEQPAGEMPTRTQPASTQGAQRGSAPQTANLTQTAALAHAAGTSLHTPEGSRPKDSLDNTSPTAAKASTTPYTPRGTVLIAEDNAVTHYFLKIVLEKHGVTVLSAHNGNEALKLLRTHKPDLILADIRMPHMDGCALTERIRSGQGSNPDVPVVVLSASISAQERTRFAALRVTDFVNKPLSAAALMRVVTPHLPNDAAATPSLTDAGAEFRADVQPHGRAESKTDTEAGAEAKTPPGAESGADTTFTSSASADTPSKAPTPSHAADAPYAPGTPDAGGDLDTLSVFDTTLAGAQMSQPTHTAANASRASSTPPSSANDAPCASSASFTDAPCAADAPCEVTPHSLHTGDFDHQAALAAMDNDVELLRHIITLWLEEGEQYAIELAAAMNTADTQKVTRLAHGWKNSAATLHLEQVRACCEKLEHAPCEQRQALFAALLPAHQRSMQALRHFIGG